MRLPDYAPFSPEQRSALDQLLGTFTAEQATWLSGYVSGVQAASGGSSLPAAAPQAKPKLTILFGTESGNCEALADQTKKLATKAGFKTSTLSMADANVAAVAKCKNVLVIVSTWGDGDPPEGAVAFCEEILSDSAAKMEGVNYSVCALGDSSYEQFCETGKQIDARLKALGGTEIYPRQDCDVDFEEPWSTWSKAALAAFPVEVASAPAMGGAALVGGGVFDKKNPFPAEVLESIVLNGTGSAKETIHIELGLEGSGLTYEVGDALALVPENRPEDVDAVLKASGFSANTMVGGKSLADVLRTDLDITSLTSRIAGKYNDLAGDKKLEEFLAKDKKKEFAEWAWGRQLVDLLEEFPCKNLTVEGFTGVLKKLNPRLYSIASSIKAHPDEVHLTIAAVRYQSHGRDRVGVASTFVADRIEKGSKVLVYVHHNKNFRLPEDPSTPVIMVGPGTGIAPFRAFVEERHASGAKGENWLFFGDQHYNFDFLYHLEWQDYLKEGLLSKLSVAFSRDQPEKIYVQDRIRESAQELYGWIEKGAHIYICGDASRMAKDVHAALVDVIAEHGGKSKEDAEAQLVAMRKAKRYQKDVY